MTLTATGSSTLVVSKLVRKLKATLRVQAAPNDYRFRKLHKHSPLSKNF
jgi:hypothetical protein